MNMVDKFYDLIDNCCTLLNAKLHLNYLDCLIRVCKDLTVELDESKLEEEDVKILQNKYEEISKLEINNEEVRQAMELLIIKGAKHVNMSLDLMTPDYINYIFGYLVNSYFKNKKDKITILDPEVGTGNMINAVSNFIEMDSKLIGIENNADLIDLCRGNTEVQNNEISLYFQDTLTTLLESADVVIGDLNAETKDNKYYPYEIILNYNKNINEGGIFIYLIENDFFTKPEIEKFRKEFKGTFLGLFVLPTELFQKGTVGKSILVGSPKYISDFEMMAAQMPNVNDKEKFLNSLQDIQNWINRIKEI